VRRPLFSCLLMLLALATASCSGGEKTETAAEQKTAREEATGAKVAPVLARPDLLAGGWLRPAREAGREGLSITPDGTLRLVGYLQSGLDWSLDGDTGD